MAYWLLLDQKRRTGRQNIMQKPKVVCLCGSTRFYRTFQEANFRETMGGNIVLSVGFFPHAQNEMHGEHVGISEEEKEALDQLHFRKIDMADEILVLNVGGYIGQSTSREIAHATATGKTVRYWLSENPLWLEPTSLLSAIEQVLEQARVPKEVWIGTDSVADRVQWLAVRCKNAREEIVSLRYQMAEET